MIDDRTLAEYALLAYNEPNIIVDNAAAHVSIVDNTTLVAVAGTNDLKDAWADIKAVPWKPAELQRKNKPSVWVHAGMWFYTKKLIKPVMAQIIMNNLPVRYTGHSLGADASGKLAILAKRWGHNVIDWTTFGCPRGGFAEYNALTRDIPGKRFVREGDLVPHVPALLNWSHDREATMLQGSEGLIDHLMNDYRDSL